MNLFLSPTAITKFMVLIITFLLVMHLTQMGLYYYYDDSDVFDWVELIDFGYEANIPSIYSVIALMFTALLLSIITSFNKQQNKPYIAWLGLTLIFVFLGFDEGASLHEQIGDFTEDYVIDTDGYLYYEWVIPYAILLTIFILSYIKFLITLPKAIAIQFVVAGTMFVSGAVGLEMISAKEADINDTDTIKYSILYTTEELLEMTAIVVFINALLKYIKTEIGTIKFSLK